MQAVPIHLREANAFVAKHHRHSIPTVGGKFAVGVWHQDKLVGVALGGMPMARRLDDGKTLGVLRVCTDGTPNVCSFLYNRVRRVAHLLGYETVVTHTLADESGASLRAVGARPVAEVEPGEWNVPSRPRKSQPVYAKKKVRWKL